MRHPLRPLRVFAGVFLALAFAGPAQAEEVIGLTVSDALVKFDSAAPSVAGSPIPVTGLESGESLCGIDFRPANGLLYTVGSTGTLYTIDTTTGAATRVGSPGAISLAGSFFGIDFDPVADRLRLVSDADQNLRINPDTGAVDLDSVLGYAVGDANEGKNPAIVGSSYANNVAGGGSTTLFGIDAALDILAVQSGGTLTTRGQLGVNVDGNVGSDISGPTGQAYLAVGGASTSVFMTRDLNTGQATPIGTVAHPLRGLSALPGGATTPPPPGPELGPAIFTLRDARPSQFVSGRGTITNEAVVTTVRCPAPGPTPLTGPKPFDIECLLQLNFSFSNAGPSTAQRRRAVVIAKGRARLRGGRKKRVRAKLTRAGRKAFRHLQKKRVKGRLSVKVRYRQPGQADQTRTLRRNVTLRVQRRR
jgi:Domain of unknown function (DUF4394)